MQEFAPRTHQQSVAKLAKDYRPAIIDQAAIRVRVEKLPVNGKMKYRVVGILWGGTHPVKRLQARFNPEEDYTPVREFRHTSNDPWTFGLMRGTQGCRDVSDPVESGRSGYHQAARRGLLSRMVEVTEI